MFARAVDNDDTIKTALQNLVFLQVDCEKGEGPEIAKKFGVRGYPTFLMTNAEGVVTDGLIGYPGPDQWAAFVAAGKADPRPIPEKQAAFEKEPTQALALALANHAASAMDNTAAVKYFRVAREFDPANAGHYTSEIMTNMYYGARSGAFTLDDVEAEAKNVLADPAASPEDLLGTARMMRNVADGQGQIERAIPFIKAALAASEGDEDLAKSRQSLEIDAALLIDKDQDKAVALKRQSMPEGWQEDPERLNQFAWWCFENKVNLDEAQAMALRGVELAADDSVRANILDTVAEICSARGDCDEAIAHIKQAIELDPDKEYFKEQLARFEKELADKKG